jgi:hypothetical protein
MTRRLQPHTVSASPLRLSRRSLLQVGSLGLSGLSLPQLMAAERQESGPAPRARSCILIYLEGGPAHQDLWDMKPQAPVEIRGLFQPISTSVPGIQICEHLPMLAEQMHHLSLIRSVHHTVLDHNAGQLYSLTGRSPLRGSQLITDDLATNFPNLGSVVSRLRPSENGLPSFMQMPDYRSNGGSFAAPGQRAGFLGSAYDPFIAGDPSLVGYTVPGLNLLPDVPLDRIRKRRQLLEALQQSPGSRDDERRIRDWEANSQRAMDLIASPLVQQAFDIEKEPAHLRERYGLDDGSDRTRRARNFAGLPALGQCMLMARRLVESGVRLVTVCSGKKHDQTWDTHRNQYPLLRKNLPYLDRSFSALLEDLAERGLLEETLVVAMGEFGRTPKLGVFSSNGADSGSRDHWPNCYTILMAGAGIAGGAVYGASDRFAAYPTRDAVTPEDITATIFHTLGLDPRTDVFDPFELRNKPIALGQPIHGLFA